MKGVGRISQLYLPGNHYDIGTAAKIYARQCSSTVRTLLEAHDGDVTEIIRTAEKAKLNKKQREALRELQMQREDDEEQRLWDEEASRNAQNVKEILAARSMNLDKVAEWKAGEDETQVDELEQRLWDEEASKNSKTIISKLEEMDDRLYRFRIFKEKQKELGNEKLLNVYKE